jgi:tripartite-type tricarboxylate transporter receptor subunit TctC
VIGLARDHGAEGLTPAQVAWESAAQGDLVPEWQSDLEKNYWSNDFVTSAQFRKDLENDYAEMKLVLADLGLAKR